MTRAARGDVIAGLIWGGEFAAKSLARVANHLFAGEAKGRGAYSEYAIADQRICFKVPKSVSPAEAATVPLASATAQLALFSKDCLSIDRKVGKDVTVLIWGGSCAYHTLPPLRLLPHLSIF